MHEVLLVNEIIASHKEYHKNIPERSFVFCFVLIWLLLRALKNANTITIGPRRATEARAVAHLPRAVLRVCRIDRRRLDFLELRTALATAVAPAEAGAHASAGIILSGAAVFEPA